jgi:hypothetical protein
MGTNLREASAMDAETSDPLHKPELVRCAAGAEAEGRPGAPRHPVATAGQLVHLQRRSRRQAPRALAPPRLCHRGWCNGRHQAYKCGTRPCCGQRSVAIAHTPAFFLFWWHTAVKGRAARPRRTRPRLGRPRTFAPAARPRRSAPTSRSPTACLALTYTSWSPPWAPTS